MGILENRVALVTGGSGGLGRAIAEAYAAAGAVVCVADLARAKPVEAAADLGGQAFGIDVDVTDPASLAELVGAVTARTGRLDIAVANAGLFLTEPFLETTPLTFDRLFAVNSRGVLFTIQAAARPMIAQGTGGKIVVIASGAARHGTSAAAAYCASKAAAVSLTQSAAAALAAHRITVNALAPGLVETAMADEVFRQYARDMALSDAELRARFVAEVPFGRLGQTADMVGAALFFASAASDFITGQTLNVDGGLYMN